MPRNTAAKIENELRAVLPVSAFPSLTDHYLCEPRGRWQGQGGLLVAPDSTCQIAQLVRIAHAAGVGIIPFGGGTGLVGGQVAPDGPAPIILSLERMRRIRAIYPDENTLVAEAGVILATAQEAARDVGRLLPLSLASEGSAQIGGLLATNAGGMNVLRYGMARDQVLGIEAVLPNGDIYHGLKRLRKDNMGMDLRHLLIGAEGALGVITAASLKLASRPAVQATALLHVAGPAAALDVLNHLRNRVGDQISLFELIHRQGPDFLAETHPDFTQPWASPPEWAVLIQLGMGIGSDPNQVFEGVFETGLVADGVIAQSDAQATGLIALREMIPVANKAIGSISSHDISLPLSEMSGFIADTPAQLAQLGCFRINCFGHLGDGNLHYNIFPPKGQHRDAYLGQRDAIKTLIHDLTHARGGSVGAEHGVGRLKVGDMERYGDPAHLAAMRAIKSALDPAGIMNPGVMLADRPLDDL